MLKNLVEDIYSAIPRSIREPELRLSAIGTPCERRLWYSVNAPDKAQPIAGDQKLRFEYGNILEKQILEYVKAAGYRVELEQYEVEINGVKGHIDCLISGCLVDIKSSSASGFGKFKRGLEVEDPFGYLDQINAYHWALRDHQKLLDKEHVYFLAVNKSSGEIILDAYSVSGRDYSTVVSEKYALVNSPRVPERSYEEIRTGSGNKYLGVECSYCPFKGTCWGNLEAYKYAGGTRYFTHIERKPRVELAEQF